MTDILSKEKRSWNMSRIRGKNTKPEVVLRSMLHKKGLRFRIHHEKLPGKPDIVLPGYRTVIFVNGCFWHRHPECKFAYVPKTRQDFWLKKFQKTIMVDKRNNMLISEAGWHVIQVWECELEKNSDKVLHTILLELKKSNDGN